MKSLTHLVFSICMTIVLIDQRSTCYAQSYDNQCTAVRSGGTLDDLVGKGVVYYSTPSTLLTGAGTTEYGCTSYEYLQKNSEGFYESTVRLVN
ncbi:hypothetical protein CHUAL_000239 [Chamberlinius hualienensis]